LIIWPMLSQTTDFDATCITLPTTTTLFVQWNNGDTLIVDGADSVQVKQMCAPSKDTRRQRGGQRL